VIGLRRRRSLAGALLVYVTLVLTLQIFLVSIAAEGFLADEPGLAWAATVLSVVLAGISGLFYRLLRER
jgi:hypothetical protein